jgi:hypothetical protein
LRVDPIQLAQEAAPRLTSTEQLRAVFDDWRAEVAPKAAREKADGE